MRERGAWRVRDMEGWGGGGLEHEGGGACNCRLSARRSPLLPSSLLLTAWMVSVEGRAVAGSGPAPAAWPLIERGREEEEERRGCWPRQTAREMPRRTRGGACALAVSRRRMAPAKAQRLLCGCAGDAGARVCTRRKRAGPSLRRCESRKRVSFFRSLFWRLSPRTPRQIRSIMEDVPDSKDYSFPGEELKVLEWWDEVREMRRERESECSRRASAGVGTAVQAPALTPSFRR